MRSLSYCRNDFYYLHPLDVEKWQKLKIWFLDFKIINLTQDLTNRNSVTPPWICPFHWMVILISNKCTSSNIKSEPNWNANSLHWYCNSNINNKCWHCCMWHTWCLYTKQTVHPTSAANMHRWTGSALVQIMACRLFGAKPLPKPMLGYCHLHP